MNAYKTGNKPSWIKWLSPAYIMQRLPDNKFCGFLFRYLYLFICFFDFAFLDVFFRVIYHGAGHTYPWDKIPNLFTLIWCCILTAVIWLLPGIAKRIFIIAAASVNTLFVLVHCGMHSFNNKFFSFSDIMFADDGAAFFKLEYINIRKLMWAAAFLCVIVSVLAALIAPKHEKYSRVRIIASVLAIVLAITGIFLIERAWLSSYVAVSWDSYKQNSDLYQSFTDTSNCMLLTGLYQYTFRDLWLTLGVNEIFDDDDEIIASIDEYVNTREPDPDNEMTGIFKDKNLILIQLEAIDTWMCNELAMPNLYAIKNESIDFTQHYAPMYLAGGTFNTEIMVNLGFIPPVYGGKTGIYAGNYFPISLPNLFRSEGYTANSFHNSRAEVYSRGICHPNWGYEHYYSGEAINMPNIELDSDLIAGFELMTGADKFFTYIITYSGHGAYIGSEISALYFQKFAELYPDADDMYIHAMAHAYETDLFIGELKAALDEAGLADDTVLVFYSDHYNYYVLDDSLVMKYKDVYDSRLIEHVMFFIDAPNVEPMKVDKVTATYDIMPTLVNMFGFDVDARYYAGNDAFSEGGGYVIFADYSWYDGENYYIYGSDAESELINERNNEINKRFYISNRILLTDYFDEVDFPSLR